MNYPWLSTGHHYEPSLIIIHSQLLFSIVGWNWNGSWSTIHHSSASVTLHNYHKTLHHYQPSLNHHQPSKPSFIHSQAIKLTIHTTSPFIAHQRRSPSFAVAAALDALLLHRQLVQGLPQPVDGLRQAVLKDLAIGKWMEHRNDTVF